MEVLSAALCRKHATGFTLETGKLEHDRPPIPKQRRKTSRRDPTSMVQLFGVFCSPLLEPPMFGKSEFDLSVTKTVHKGFGGLRLPGTRNAAVQSKAQGFGASGIALGGGISAQSTTTTTTTTTTTYYVLLTTYHFLLATSY